MEYIKLAQIHNSSTQSKEKQREILKKVDVKYCIPDVVTHKQQKKYNYSGYTSLHFAVKSLVVDLDLVNELLEQGSDLVKQGTQDGCTPVHLAFNEYISSPRSLHTDKTNSLQKNKCITLLSKQVEIQNISNPKSSNGISHLHIACVINHVAAVEFFARAKDNVNQRINCDASHLSGYTPLHCAIEFSSIKVAEILLQYGADINLKDAKGMSCVHLLTDRILDITDFINMGMRTYCNLYEEEIERIESIIKLVLKAKVSDGIFMGHIGLSAVHVACILKDKSIIEHFLKQNVDVNSPVQDESKFWPGWTPLHFAACCNIETMILLMQRGADITVKNSKGETALDLCAKRFASPDFQKVLSAKNEYKDIVLSDSSTKLMDLLSAMGNYEKFSVFLQKLEDVNITIPSNSPIWPGCNLLHVSVSLNVRAERKNPLKKKFHFPEAKDAIKRYNCTEDKEMLHSKRIDLLLEYGCSTSTKNADGQTPIHLGFRILSQDALDKLLRCDNEDAADPNGLTHLHIACALSRLDAVEKYVRGGADVNARAGIGFRHRYRYGGEKQVRADSTPLHVAVIFNREDIVRHLLKNNADVHATDSLAFTPIHLLMFSYNFDLARLLLDAATATNLRDSVCVAGLSHLHLAAYSNHHEAVSQLLLDGADIERVVGKDVEQFPFLEEFAGKTPLHVAQQTDARDAAEILLKAGANIHVKNVDGISALHDAVFDYKGHESSRQLLRMLRESGKSNEVEKHSDGITLLHVACALCDVEWAERLLAEGADVNARARGGQLDGATPLYVALDTLHIPDDYPMYSFQRRYNLVELLADRGADVTIKCCGSTPLCWLCLNVLRDFGSHLFDDDVENAFLLRSVDLLLRSQESYRVNPVDERGFSHLHLACLSNDVEAATKFLDHGADVNLSIDPFDRNTGGFTPLHFAMAHKRIEVAYLLLDRGADVNAEDTDGNTPLHVAFEKRFLNMPLIESMIRLGVDVRAKNLGGYTLLHLLVKWFNHLPSDEYLSIIERTGMGSCLYQRDGRGDMPLHVAMNYNNPEALEALFSIGFNINSVNLEKEFRVDRIIECIREHIMNAIAELVCHIWKIRFVRLDLTNSNLRFLESLEEQFSVVALLDACQDELTKTTTTKICEGVTVNNFLSELGAAATYPRMHGIQRAIIDKYFNCTVDLYREFPEFCGLLVLQYRRAIDRQDLMQPAKEAIASIFQVELPDLCLEAVLRFFTNDEMKVLIDVAKELYISCY